jgi:hypothetical protein
MALSVAIAIPIGHLLVGSLKFQYLELVKLKEINHQTAKKIATDIGRREYSSRPDGFIYIGVEGKNS